MSERPWQPDPKIVKVLLPFVYDDDMGGRENLRFIKVTVSPDSVTYEATNGHLAVVLKVSGAGGEPFVGFMDRADAGWFIGGEGHAPAQWHTEAVDFPDIAGALPPPAPLKSEAQRLSGAYLALIGTAAVELGALHDGSRFPAVNVETGTYPKPARFTMTVNPMTGSIKMTCILAPLRRGA